MSRGHFRRVSIGIIFFVMILQDAVPGQALDFSNFTLIYHEDFEGEIGFPTQPEINVLSIGATSPVGVDGADQFFPGPFLSGGAAIGSIHSETPPSRQNVSVPSTFSDSFGMRATFDSFSLGVAPADGTAEAGVVAAFETLPAATSVVSASLGLIGNSGTTSGFVVLTYTEPPPVRAVLSSAPLSPSAVAAVLSGASFTVDLAFDKATLIATGSVDVSGFGVFTAPPLDVTNLFLQEHQGLDADVRMEDISVLLPGSLPSLIGDQILIEPRLPLERSNLI